jgi:large subunit ribosomal protein L23
MDSHPLEILRRPIITEKIAIAQEAGKYAFEVHSKSNKKEIKKAVEEAFKVKVLAVNVMNVKGKTKRSGTTVFKTRNWKKAIVTLAQGDRIEVFEGM